MKWNLDDSYLQKTKGLVRPIAGRGDRPLPWWFAVDWLRPALKTLLWQFAVMFGVDESLAAEGYRLGFIADGHAYLGDEMLHHSCAYILIRRQDWTFFAVDRHGEVVPDEGGKQGDGKRFWVDVKPDYAMSWCLDGRPQVD